MWAYATWLLVHGGAPGVPAAKSAQLLRKVLARRGVDALAAPPRRLPRSLMEGGGGRRRQAASNGLKSTARAPAADTEVPSYTEV